MKRIIVALFSIGILLGILSGEDTKESGKELGVEVLTQEEIDLLCSGKEFLEFETNIQFDGYDLGYDKAQNMLLIPQEIENKFFNGKLKAQEDELFFLADDLWNDKQNAVSSNHVFRLFRIGEEQYWMYNVYFTGMPVANLSTEYVSETNENYGTMWVFDQYRDSSRYQQGKCRFRLRGASSLAFPKSSYKVTFIENDFSLLGMREDDDWILNSLYDDEGLIHNKISYELWHEIAESNSVANDEGISMEFVEVFVDNTYMGVYGLLERVDKKALSLNEKDILYKGAESKDVGEDDFYAELTEDMNPTFEMKYPEEFTEEHWTPLKEWVYGLNYGQCSDYEEAKQMLNMENAIDYFLFNMFLCGEDNTWKNIYYWADYQNDGTYQIIKIPWDLNMTWGNAWCEPHEYHFNLYQEICIEKAWGKTKDIEYLYEMNPEKIGELLKIRWHELREDIITQENIYAMLDSQFNYIHSAGAYERDCLFWGSREAYWSDSYIYDYTDKKIKMMDEYIESL